MSSIGKSEKFRQNENFKCLLQPSMQEVFRKDYRLKGKWRSEIFKNNNPITLELGCGKGEYTIALAEKYTNRNFIGIDIKGARLWKGAKYAETNNMANVCFIRTSIDFIEWLFAKDEVAEIWITFADPQLQSPRKRLTGTLFLERYNKFLIPGGIVHLKTDSRFLHEYTKAIAEQNSCKILACNSNIYAEAQKNNIQNYPPELLTVQTFYEKFFLSQGLKITYLEFQLPADKEQFSEPIWDKNYWKLEEEKGRTKNNIR